MMVAVPFYCSGSADAGAWLLRGDSALGCGKGLLAALLDFVIGLAPELALVVDEGVFNGFAVTAEVDDIEEGQCAENAPDEAEDESEGCGGSKVGDGGLPFFRSGRVESLYILPQGGIRRR